MLVPCTRVGPGYVAVKLKASLPYSAVTGQRLTPVRTSLQYSIAAAAVPPRAQHISSEGRTPCSPTLLVPQPVVVGIRVGPQAPTTEGRRVSALPRGLLGTMQVGNAISTFGSALYLTMSLQQRPCPPFPRFRHNSARPCLRTTCFPSVMHMPSRPYLH